MRRTLSLVALILVGALGLQGAAAESYASAGAEPYRGRKWRLSVNGGYGQTNDRNYGVVGLGVGYFVVDGLEAGLDGEAWFGDKPQIYKISPNIRYVLLGIPNFNPYVGAFYRKIIYQGLENFDSVGGRAGLSWALSANTSANAGLVYERILNCDKSIDSDCTKLYPEAGVSLSF